LICETYFNEPTFELPSHIDAATNAPIYTSRWFSESIIVQEIDECLSNPCQNNASCVDGKYSYTCTCLPGYSGTHCETDSNECLSNPCQNSATCVDGQNSYICICLPGYTDTHCETDINECLSNPCQNSATCVDGQNSYTCICLPANTGTYCEIGCPADFVNYPSVNGCYKFILAALTWEQARTRCTLEHPSAHAVVVNNAAEDQLLLSQLNSFGAAETEICAVAAGKGFYTSGQLTNPLDCRTAYVWKPNSTTTLPMAYTNWYPGLPNCVGGVEACHHYYGTPLYIWNDIPCNSFSCVICEIDI